MSWYRLHRETPPTYFVWVKAKPKSHRSCVVGVTPEGDALIVAVAAPPVDGEANAELRRCLAKWLHVRLADVEISRGGQSRHKQFIIEGVTEETLQRLGVP